MYLAPRPRRRRSSRLGDDFNWGSFATTLVSAGSNIASAVIRSGSPSVIYPAGALPYGTVPLAAAPAVSTNTVLGMDPATLAILGVGAAGVLMALSRN